MKSRTEARLSRPGAGAGTILVAAAAVALVVAALSMAVPSSLAGPSPAVAGFGRAGGPPDRGPLTAVSGDRERQAGQPGSPAPAEPPAGSGPTSRPDAGAGPPRLQVTIKVVTGSKRTIPDLPRSEEWIIRRAAEHGSPQAADNCDWVELTPKKREIHASLRGGRLIDARVEGKLGAGPVLAIISGFKMGRSPRKIQLFGRLGECKVVKLTDYPAPGNLFAAIQVVQAPATADIAWGKTVAGLRLGLLVKPTTWRPDDDIEVTCLAENLSDKPIRIADWRAVRDGLVLTGPKGKQVRGGTARNRGVLIRTLNTVAVIQSGQSVRYTVTGALEKGKLTVRLRSGGVLHWPNAANESLTPGVYTLAARMANARSAGRLRIVHGKPVEYLWPGPQALSPPVRITITDKPAGK